MKAGLHRAERNIEGVGDLVQAQAIDKAEQESFPMLRGKTCQCGAELIASGLAGINSRRSRKVLQFIRLPSVPRSLAPGGDGKVAHRRIEEAPKLARQGEPRKFS